MFRMLQNQRGKRRRCIVSAKVAEVGFNHGYARSTQLRNCQEVQSARHKVHDGDWRIA